MVDLDGDGLLDLVAGQAVTYLHFFRNTGTRAAFVFEDASEAVGGVFGTNMIASYDKDTMSSLGASEPTA